MFIRGHIVTPSAVVPGVLGFFEQIVSIKAARDVAPRYIVPGFIDLHVHGGGGGDTMDGVEGIQTTARFHLTHGTTSLLPTTITNPWPDVLGALRAVSEARGRDAENGAGILGAHLEGPFINRERLGAQPPFAILPEEQRVAEALGIGVVRVVTLAPEIEHGMEAAKQFARAGVRVSLGHSTADYANAKAAIASVVRSGGTPGGTHLYNAMGGMEGRTPGLVGALLGSGQAWAELILDLHHVHPGAFLAAYAAMGDRLFLITDAIRGTGLGDGESELGGRKVTIRSGVARLKNGSLAGSVLTMDTALRNALAQGLSLPQAARLTSTNPARYLGLTDRGAIMPGQRADFVVLDTQMRVVEVWREGRRRI
jgi:N-acetylglucosamine-6-phosphate deacetylase